MRLEPVIVEYDCFETPDQEKARIKAGLPRPKYSFTVEKIDEQPRKQDADQREKAQDC